jgi:hypothetical protein
MSIRILKNPWNLYVELDRVRVAHLFSFLCCVIVCPMLSVSLGVSIFFILPFYLAIIDELATNRQHGMITCGYEGEVLISPTIQTY